MGIDMQALELENLCQRLSSIDAAGLTGRPKEASTQCLCPGCCHHTRNDLRARQRDSAKYSRFIKVRVHTHEGGQYGRTEEVRWGVWVEVLINYEQGESMGVVHGL